VQRDLFVGRRERPRDLRAALLPEHEAKLTRRAESVRMVGTEGGTGPGVGHRAQEVLMKEAILAARFGCPSPCCHACIDLSLMCEAQPDRCIKAPPRIRRKLDSRKTQELPRARNSPQIAGFFEPAPGSCRIFRSFLKRWPPPP
jgi:hypothetical protein